MTQKIHKRKSNPSMYAYEREDQVLNFNSGDGSKPVGDIELKEIKSKKLDFDQNEIDMNPDKFYSGFEQVLNNITLNIEPGSKVCLVGKPGSGVNFFMLTMMGEAVLNQGNMKMNGRLSYLSSYSEIIFEGTIKDNILVGEKYNADRFVEVIDLVELDLTRFPAGEEMEILHHASNMSTDERKKMLLARLLYHNGDIVCLDYFFDSWYPILAERIFNKLLNGFFKDKTVIYSTDVSSMIRSSDMVLYFENGQIL